MMPSCKGWESYRFLLFRRQGVETDFAASVDAHTLSTFVCRSNTLLRLSKFMCSSYLCCFFFQKNIKVELGNQ